MVRTGGLALKVEEFCLALVAIIKNCACFAFFAVVICSYAICWKTLVSTAHHGTGRWPSRIKYAEATSSLEGLKGGALIQGCCGLANNGIASFSAYCCFATGFGYPGHLFE